MRNNIALNCPGEEEYSRHKDRKEALGDFFWGGEDCIFVEASKEGGG